MPRQLTARTAAVGRDTLKRSKKSIPKTYIFDFCFILAGTTIVAKARALAEPETGVVQPEDTIMTLTLLMFLLIPVALATYRLAGTGVAASPAASRVAKPAGSSRALRLVPARARARAWQR